MFNWLRKKIRQHEVRTQLRGLTLRELNDIGIGMGDIERIVREVE